MCTEVFLMRLAYLLQQIKVKYDTQETPSLLTIMPSNVKQFPKHHHMQ